MKYAREERLAIGKRIYDGELNRYQAAEEYGIYEVRGVGVEKVFIPLGSKNTK